MKLIKLEPKSEPKEIWRVELQGSMDLGDSSREVSALIYEGKSEKEAASRALEAMCLREAFPRGRSGMPEDAFYRAVEQAFERLGWKGAGQENRPFEWVIRSWVKDASGESDCDIGPVKVEWINERGQSCPTRLDQDPEEWSLIRLFAEPGRGDLARRIQEAALRMIAIEERFDLGAEMPNAPSKAARKPGI